MVVKLNNEAIAAVELILKRGNKAVVQRNGQGIIIMEEKRKIEYRNTDSDGSRERAI